MLSGPTHGCWLQFYWGIGGRSVDWEGTERTASDTIIAMDRYTLQALETGYVDLPRRKIHARIWFRLLRTILDELSTPLSQCGNNAKVLRRVWETCGHPVRAGLLLWCPFEFMKVSTQLQMLEAAATAIQMMEEKSITPFGEMAGLFCEEPQTEWTDGDSPVGISQDISSPWHAAIVAINEAFAAACHSPETACSLFEMALGRQRDASAVRKLFDMFVKEGILEHFLSHYLCE